MRRGAWLVWLGLMVLGGAAGCGADRAVEGTVTMTSTAAFKNTRAIKPPPPQIPKN
jgi:hypothetical protein